MLIKFNFFQRLLWLSLLLVLVNLPVAGQTSNTRRIQVKAGGPAAVVKGQVTKEREAVYEFNARAGQKFSGRITKKQGDIGFELVDPDGEGLDEEEFDFNTKLNGNLTKTGTYKIIVRTFATRPARFTMTVRITR